MRRILGWISSSKGKGAGFSFLSAGNLLIAFITYLRFAKIAQIYGTTWQTDAVAIALVIPLLLQQLISTAFGSVFLPIYSRVIHDRGEHAGSMLISRIISWMSLSGVVLIGLVYASGAFVVRLVGPGAEMETTALAARVLWVLLPMVFLNAIEGVLQNFLYYGKRFGLVSFLRVLQIFISYLVVLVGHRSMGIMVIPVSALAGAATSFSVCAVVSFRFRLRVKPRLGTRDPDFRETIRLAIPITIGVVTGFLGPVADKVLASYLRPSSVTAIDYASRIKNLVRMILIQPVMVLSTVSFSRIAAERDTGRLKNEIAGFVKNISYYTLPASGIIVLLAAPLISVLFQRGNFGPEQSRHVGYALAFYSPWFAQFGIGLIIRRAFFSIRETVTPVVLGIWAVIANILLNIILVGPMGIGGLALATTVTSGAKTLLQMYFLRKRLGGIRGSVILPEFLKILAATAVMMGYILLAGRFFPVDLEASLSGRVLSISLAVIPGIVLYVAATMLFRSTTIRVYTEAIRRKLSRSDKRSDTD